MAEWPMSIGRILSEDDAGKAPIVAGTRLSVSPTFDEDGRCVSYIFLCPSCGELGDLPIVDRDGTGRAWSASLNEENELSLDPPILCSCGGHFWLTDGVLREV